MGLQAVIESPGTSSRITSTIVDIGSHSVLGTWTDCSRFENTFLTGFVFR